MIEEFRSSPCVRSGYCCKNATCAVGVENGAAPEGCHFLKGDKPGFYSCALAENSQDLRAKLFVGEGCSSAAFNTFRIDAKRNLARDKLSRT